ncbi:MAG: transposase [Gemmatimonadetes bacterium]|nr:transposase [Gemmatimonadota bacterium]
MWVSAEDRGFTVRLARYCARHPAALGRLGYRADSGTVSYQSDKASVPTAGAETVDALGFLARVVRPIPTKGPVLQRYYCGCGTGDVLSTELREFLAETGCQYGAKPFEASEILREVADAVGAQAAAA